VLTKVLDIQPKYYGLNSRSMKMKQFYTIWRRPVTKSFRSYIVETIPTGRAQHDKTILTSSTTTLHFSNTVLYLAWRALKIRT